MRANGRASGSWGEVGGLGPTLIAKAHLNFPQGSNNAKDVMEVQLVVRWGAQILSRNAEKPLGLRPDH